MSPRTFQTALVYDGRTTLIILLGRYIKNIHEQSKNNSHMDMKNLHKQFIFSINDID